ncbi:trypsin-1-like [Chironomus tepperi]|uniref:trypsin-1-like n=1 Tax=Chironomus tepperi TaxID=113505 RepID=UPI00391F4AFB
MDLKYILFSFLIILQLSFGKSEGEGGSKIVGGQIMDITNVPYFASLLFNDRHICGGSIISESWILSAAHCGEEKHAQNFTIRTGSSRKSRGGLIHAVESVYSHPNYSASTLDNDFMLLKLKVPLKFDSTRQAIQLGESYMYYQGAHVLTSGLGSTQDAMQSSEFLRGVIVEISSSKTCKTAYPNMITKNMFCAAGEKKDSCQGDSGGPVESVYYGTLLGVVSFGVSCADEKYPGVYSKVSEATEWIKSVTNIGA